MTTYMTIHFRFTFLNLIHFIQPFLILRLTQKFYSNLDIMRTFIFDKIFVSLELLYHHKYISRSYLNLRNFYFRILQHPIYGVCLSERIYLYIQSHCCIYIYILISMRRRRFNRLDHYFLDRISTVFSSTDGVRQTKQPSREHPAPSHNLRADPHQRGQRILWQPNRTSKVYGTNL